MLEIDTHTEGNAAWMEQQVLGHIQQALQVTLDWRTPSVGLPRKLSSVRFTLKSFVRHLERIMEMEEQDGYMVVVAERKPNMQPCIERLEKDHANFRQQIDQLTAEMEDLTEFQHDEFEEACGKIAKLLAAVDRHTADEIDLLQETLLCDEGGEG